MNLFFATLFVNVENPQILPQKIVPNRRLAHGRPRGCRWFSDDEKLQAQLPKFSITITLKPKRRGLNHKEADLQNCSASKLLTMSSLTITQNQTQNITSKKCPKSLDGRKQKNTPKKLLPNLLSSQITLK